MRKSLGALLLLIGVVAASSASAQSLPSVDPGEVGISADRLQRIAVALKRDIEDGKLPGAVVAVARNGRVVYFEAFGFLDKEAGIPMPKDAIFRIYSMTKPLTTVAAMILVEQGRLQLTDPVSKFFPALSNLKVSVPKTDSSGNASYELVPAKREMTVHDLLRHTAGLAYGGITKNAAVRDAYIEAGLYAKGVSLAERDMTAAEQVERFSKVPLIHQPGTVWEYSLASDLLGRVIEAVTGMRLGEFLEQHLFGPLTMTDTGFFVPPEQQSRVAEPLAINVASGKPNKFIDVSRPPANDSGGGGGVSTADDYLRFAQMLLKGGRLDGVQILSPTSVALMTSDHLGDDIRLAFSPGAALFGSPGYTFGLGFGVREAPGMAALPGSAGEYMWAGWAGTYFWVEPEERLVAVLMSQGQGLRRHYRRLIKQLVDQAIVD